MQNYLIGQSPRKSEPDMMKTVMALGMTSQELAEIEAAAAEYEQSQETA